MKLKLMLGLLAILAFAAGVGWQLANRADFSTLDGRDYQWRQLQGRWVVVNYFAQWCAPCLREVPELNEFAKLANSRDDIHLFAVDYDALPEKQLRAIQQQYNMQFELIKAGARKMLNDTPQQLPATFIISPSGEVKARLLGEQTSQGLLEQIEQLQLL